MKFPIFPEQASDAAAHVDALYFTLTAFSLFILAIVFLPMIFFVFKYRRSKGAPRVYPALPTVKMEITWTVVLFFIACSLFVWGSELYFTNKTVPRDALEINVIGKQWMWRVQHPEGKLELNQLHVPAGRTVKLIMASEDVIHSFYLPNFRIKQDVVPGRYTTEWFKATKPGVYHIFCAEYCGTAHSRMIGQIFVMKPEDFQQWLASGAPQEPLAASGERLFRELGCSGCHMGGTIVHAPRLEGLYGRLVPLQDRTFVQADEKYIRDSILLPQSQITAGYEPVMPTFQGRVSEEELLQLIAYVKSLGQNATEVSK